MAVGGVITTDDYLANQDGLDMGETRVQKAPKAGKRLMKFIDSANIALDLGDDLLERIGDQVVKEYEIDKASRSDWEEDMAKALDLAMQVSEPKTFPWVNASNVKYPLITVASIQFNARAYPAIVRDRNVVKCQVRGNDSGIPEPSGPAAGAAPQLPDAPAASPQMGPMGAAPAGMMAAPPTQMQPGQEQSQQWLVQPGIKQKRADRVAAHMSYQLLDEMEEWEEDTDKLLLVLPIIGCCFRKTWFDENLGRNASQMITADKLVVNDGAKSLETAPRITQVFNLYPNEIVERERMGLYREVEIGLPEDSTDEDAPHEFLEQHRWWDLDEDGYKEPYIVTVHKDTSQVVRIVARFDQEGVLTNKKGEVSKIEPTHFFTKFGFIPNPTGSFYDIGFGWLLNPLNASINTIINQLIDAGTLQTTGGGFIGDGLRIKGGSTRFRPGEYKRVNATGGSIKDNVVPLPFPGPAQTLFVLLEFLIEAAKDISSVKDIMTGDEGRGNEAATAKLARIEQGMKVFSAIYKRIFRSLKKEFKLIFRLNALYLDDRSYFTLHDTPEAVARKDYNEKDMDVAPVADPNMISDMQRLGHAEFLLQFRDDPMVEQREIRRRAFEAAQIQDVDKLLDFEPPPNPAIALKADEIDLEKRQMALKEADLALKQADMQGKAQISEIEALAKGEEITIQRQKVMADVAKTKAEIVKILAEADEKSSKPGIEEMKVMAQQVLERGRLRLEARKAEIEQTKADAASARANPGGNGSLESASGN